MTGHRAVEVRITGRVQGVSFRAWTEERARALALTGWVRNLPDGTVEALFVGPPDAVTRMLAECRGGPRLARVDGVESRDVAPPPELADFRTRR